MPLVNNYLGLTIFFFTTFSIADFNKFTDLVSLFKNLFTAERLGGFSFLLLTSIYK